MKTELFQVDLSFCWLHFFFFCQILVVAEDYQQHVGWQNWKVFLKINNFR